MVEGCFGLGVAKDLEGQWKWQTGPHSYPGIIYIGPQLTRTSLTSSLNTGNLPIGYPCPNFRLAINFADLKASLILWVCLRGLQIIHASFVFEGRINRPLEKKSLGVQKHEDFKIFEHPVAMQLPPGQGNWDASADCGEASYHGIPITPSTPRTPKLVGFKFDSSQIQDDWNISKRDQTFYNPWGWILQTSIFFFVSRRF